MDTGGNPAQQLPNTDTTSNGANNWQNPNWNSIDWGSFDYYNWAMPMMYWENNPWGKDKGKQKGGTLIRIDKPKHPQTRSGGGGLC